MHDWKTRNDGNHVAAGLGIFRFLCTTDLSCQQGLLCLSALPNADPTSFHTQIPIWGPRNCEHLLPTVYSLHLVAFLLAAFPVGVCGHSVCWVQSDFSLLWLLSSQFLSLSIRIKLTVFKNHVFAFKGKPSHIFF